MLFCGGGGGGDCDHIDGSALFSPLDSGIVGGDRVQSGDNDENVDSLSPTSLLPGTRVVSGERVKLAVPPATVNRPTEIGDDAPPRLALLSGKSAAYLKEPPRSALVSARTGGKAIGDLPTPAEKSGFTRSPMTSESRMSTGLSLPSALLGLLFGTCCFLRLFRIEQQYAITQRPATSAARPTAAPPMRPSVTGNTTRFESTAICAIALGEGNTGRWMTSLTPIDSSGTPAPAASAESGTASESAAPLRDRARSLSRPPCAHPGQRDPSTFANTSHPNLVASAFS